MALWASPATDEMGETRAVVQVNAVYVLAPRVRQEMGRGVCGTPNCCHAHVKQNL